MPLSAARRSKRTEASRTGAGRAIYLTHHQHLREMAGTVVTVVAMHELGYICKEMAAPDGRRSHGNYSLQYGVTGAMVPKSLTIS